MRKVLFGIATALALVLAVPADAATFIARDIVAPAEELTDDLYAAGDRVEVRHNITDDVFAAGNTVSIVPGGSVDGDFVGAGNTVTIDGPVGDDIFAAGSVVTLGDTATEDVFAAAGSLTIDTAAQVSGDAWLAGETLIIAGTVDGTVRATAQRLLVRETATITGDLIVESPHEPEVAEGATIAGEVKHVRFSEEKRDKRPFASALLGWVRGILTWLVLAYLLRYLVPQTAEAVHTRLTKSGLSSLGLGFLAFLLAVPVSGMLMATVIGIPIGVLSLTLFAAALIMAIGMSVLTVGTVAASRMGSLSQSAWQTVLVGAVIFETVSMLPFIGFILVVLLVMATLGALIRTAWDQRGSTSS